MNSKYNLIVGCLRVVVFEGYFRKDNQEGPECWWCNKTGVGYDQNGEPVRAIFPSWVRPIKISKAVFDGLVDSVIKMKKLKDIYITSARAILDAEVKKKEIKETSKKN
jgi:hypothetical protein